MDNILAPNYPSCVACIASAYDCATCSNPGADCITCDAAIDFRVLNGSRCSPLDGYYDVVNNSIAQSCDSNCSKCVGVATDCTDCIVGYYLLSKVCYLCTIQNCLRCQDSVICVTCNNTYAFNGTTCIPYLPS